MGLAVQEYLKSGGTVEQLENDLGIRSTYHTIEPLVILNYHMIDSPKNNELVRECRSLTLEKDSWNLVSRAFPRFFNWGEMLSETDQFDWCNCWASEKADGSLMTLYWYNGWRVNTRSTFADGICNFSEKTWAELFFETIPLNLIENVCQQGKSYVFEFWSPYNKVITTYPKQCSFLLTIYDGENELDQSYSDKVASRLNCLRPIKYNFSNIEEVKEFVDKKGKVDPTWEGIVLCDAEHHRWKVKNSLYLCLHHLKDNGNVFNPKRLVPLIINGEIEETILYLPEIKETADQMKIELDVAYTNLLELWYEVKDIKEQRDFAQTIIPRTKFSNLLFQCRKSGKPLNELWIDSTDLILKVLYNQ